MNKTIHQLEELTQAELTDELAIFDVSASDTKKIKVQNLIGSYSTDETFTGKYWIDGKPIFRKVVTGLNFGGTTGEWRNTGATISNVDKLINVIGIKSSEGPVGWFSYCMNGNNLQYVSYNAWSGLNTVIVEYTKSSS